MNEIAIVGMACRFPGASDPRQFWELMATGRDAISEVPAQRWDAESLYDRNPRAPGKMSSRWGGFLADVGQFDSGFFHMSAREVCQVDPQHRLLLEVAWAAFEDAGIAPAGWRAGGRWDCRRAGVFIGISNSDYRQQVTADTTQIDAYGALGNALSIAANRLSYFFDLNGPSMAIDTACSSALVAVHQACASLAAGDTGLCLAGGVNLILAPEVGIAFSHAGMLAADGRCKTFDAAADGFVRSEGAGLVLLKRLADAERDGDHIYAVIRGSAVNQDGQTAGITAPSGLAQEAVVRAALRAAQLAPAEISLVEAHGTGTRLGDPIEVRALAAVLMRDRAPHRPCWLGSVKANLGHLEPAAGIAGLIKAALCLEQGAIPPQLHQRAANPLMQLEATQFRIAHALEPWGDLPRYAGVSAFGFGGTNCHVVLAGAPPVIVREPAADGGADPALLVLSARGSEAMRALAASWQALLSTENAPLAALAHTSQCGRQHFNERLAIVAQGTGQAQQALTAFLAGQPHAALRQTEGTHGAGIGLLFTGQGAQYAGMGQALYESEPLFREVIERCDALFLRASPGARALTEVMFADQGDLLDQTAYTQPALFALEMALFSLWQARGLTPSAVMGHSVGEYAAACAAGVFSLEDGMQLITHRSRLMQALPAGGAMVVALAGPASVADLLQHDGPEPLVVAALNGPANTVLSGAVAAIERAEAALAARGIGCKRLAVSHAFHSSLMAPMLEEFRAIAMRITYHAPRIALISNLTGAPITQIDAEYWCRHILAPVLFAAGVHSLEAAGCRRLLEIGPAPVLLAMGQAVTEAAGGGQSMLWLASLRPRLPDRQVMLDSLAALYCDGLLPAWTALHPGLPPARARLPLYPFQRQPHWIARRAPAPLASVASSQSPAGLQAQRLPLPGGEPHFSRLVGRELPGYLAQHVVFGEVVLPAAAYLEFAASAACQLQDGAVLEGVRLLQPLVLEPQAQYRLHLVVTVQKRLRHFRIFSQRCVPASGADGAQDAPKWLLHVAGKISDPRPDSKPARQRLASLREHCPREVDLPALYRNFSAIGLQYGPRFQALREARAGERIALARLQLDDADIAQAGEHRLHPVLLDAALQSLASLGVLQDRSTECYLPVALGRLQYFAALPDTVWTCVRLAPDSGPASDQLSADVQLLDARGECLALLDGLRLRRVSRAALLGTAPSQPQDWLYQLAWQAQPLPATAASPGGYWLVLADHGGTATRLSAALQARGQRVVLLGARTGTSATLSATRHVDYLLDLSQPDVLPQFFTEFKQPGACLGVLHCSALDHPAGAALEDYRGEELLALLEGSCGSALMLAQAMQADVRYASVPLWLLTRGAHATIADAASQPLQAALAALGAVIAAELPALRCMRIDLDPAAQDSAAQDTEALLAELQSVACESGEQVAWRAGRRLVGRLQHLQQQQPLPRSAGSFRLGLAEYGALDGLRLLPLSLPPPAPQEVQIEVHSAGLNFRDVLNAQGLLAPVLEQMGIRDAAALPLGSECAGVVVAVGAQVHDFQPGQRVIAAPVPGALASHVNAPQDCVVHMPSSLSFGEAATIGVTFLSAFHALVQLAQVKPGDRVLIHAAAGGLGQAAVQLAQRAGAEVFATASPAKWGFLKNLGIQHVMNSRSLAFADQVLALTAEDARGPGVEIVLNSLSGDFIPASFKALAHGGVFIEAGKLAIWETAQAQQHRPDVRYQPFDLLTLAQDKPAAIAAMLRELCALFARGALQPLYRQVYPIEQSMAAFRCMAQAGQRGKIILAMREPDAPARALTIAPSATYLVTGGLGALGLEAAGWLAARGARHLLLAGRQQPGAAAHEVIARLEKRGVEVRCLAVDLACHRALSDALQEAGAGMPPLRGVIHAAGVLDDALLPNLDWQRCAKVLQPKVAGSWNLHRATRHLALDFFVQFSSVAVHFGAAGQGAYVTGNAFMDSLAWYRRAEGLPALSINWGPWAEAGMAASLDSAALRGMQAAGIRALPSRQALVALEMACAATSPQVAVLDIDWPTLQARVPHERVPAVLRSLCNVGALANTAGSSARAPATPFLQQVRSAPVMRRSSMLSRHVLELLAQVTGCGARQLSLQTPFAELGLDSLMAVEFRNLLQRSLGYSIASSMAVDYPTPEKLVQMLVVELFTTTAGGGEAPAVSGALVLVQRGLPATPPVFMVPGAGADVDYFHSLATSLGSQQPVYGFRPHGLDGRTAPHTSVQEAAQEYLQLMRQVQPQGPYRLLGHSFGGWIVFEMARQLAREGATLEPPVLLDTPVPVMQSARDPLELVMDFVEMVEQWQGKTLQVSRSLLAPLDAEQRLACLHRQMQAAQVLGQNTGRESLRGMLQVFVTNIATSYQPASPYFGPVLLLRAQVSLLDRENMPPAALWQRWAPAIESREVAGNHMNMVAAGQVTALCAHVCTAWKITAHIPQPSNPGTPP